MRRTPETIRIFGDWTPGRWLRRIRPSDMRLTADEDKRCARCGVWPDQNIGIKGDWVIEPLRLCPGCHERVEFMRVRTGDDSLETLAAHWPRRGPGPRGPNRG